MQTFKIKKEHIALIKELYFEYNDNSEFGAPTVNPKRPYGNSDVYGDIGKILKIKSDCNGDFTDAQINRMTKLHKELTIVLQIICSNPSETDYIGTWKGEYQTWNKIKKE